MIIKFILNLKIGKLFIHKTHKEYSFSEFAGYLKIGFYSYETMSEIVLYMAPEIMILTFLMFNEIYLRMNGLFYMTETEIENITDGLKRNIEKGDIDKV